MYRERRWTLAQQHAQAAELAERLGTSPLIAQILLNRGLTSFEECGGFLRPSFKTLLDPDAIPNLSKAAGRIAKAIRDGEKIVIYGDYDVDGITATTILWHAIRLLGGQADYYIPHRLEEGYGLNSEAVTQLCQSGYKVIVTVDCGITALEQAAIARERGVDLIITDHHEWKEDSGNGPILPECYAIVHPRLPNGGKAYGNPHLCGAGVAFKLSWGIGMACSGAPRVREDFRRFLIEATALAALGTIADVVPLVGENRILAHFGLGGLKQSELIGIKALIESAGLTGKKLDTYDVGFLLAPRLNACGRMGHAGLAVEMLTSADATKAMEIATYLEQQNRQRQNMEKSILQQALQQVTDRKFDSDDCRAVVLGGEGWHPGVIGIVASRIVDRLHRPTIMIALADGQGQGSGRSISGFHLARALQACASHLQAFGGHEMAAGLRLDSGNLEAFREAFCAYASQALRPEQMIPELKLECLAELRQITEAVVDDLHRLGPFGHGNRRPVLCCKGLEVAAPPRRVGRTGEHIQLRVRQGDAQLKCIAFNYGKLFDRLSAGVAIDLAVEPVINEFNGRRSVELEIKDIQFV